MPNDKEQIQQLLEEAVLRALGRGQEQGKFVDIGRIPFICDDIRGIHEKLMSIDDIKRDLNWMKYLGGGFLIAAGLLALKSLGL